MTIPNRRERGVVGERATLESFLDDYRDIVVRKVSGLSDADAGRSDLVESGTSPAGLVKHLRWAEYGWFDQFLTGRLDDNRRPHDRAREFVVEPGESVSSLVSAYQAQCDQSRRIAADFSLDHTLHHGRLDTTVSLRWIYLHMIRETARHTGQIDILREQIDGHTGFDG